MASATKTPDEDAREALISLGVGPAATELYVDLLRPAAKELGGNLLTIAKLVSLAMSPLQGVVWGLEKVRDWLGAAILKRLASAEPEQIQTPPMYIAGQILLQLPFCADQEELREMYANLLAAAMRKDLAHNVHPAFVPLIQQLSPDEVLILDYIAKMPKPLDLHESTDQNGFTRRGSQYISTQFRTIAVAAGVSSPDFSDAYLDNLLRLKILEDHHWSQGRLRESSYWDHQEVETTTSRLVQVSAFGERFLAACLPEDAPSYPS